MFVCLIKVRSAIPDITALGAAMAAGQADGIGVWELEGEDEVETVPTDTYLPTTTPEGILIQQKIQIILYLVKFNYDDENDY